jgi:hypothetical protein
VHGAGLGVGRSGFLDGGAHGVASAALAPGDGMATEAGRISGMPAEEHDVTTPPTRQLDRLENQILVIASGNEAILGALPSGCRAFRLSADGCRPPEGASCRFSRTRS